MVRSRSLVRHEPSVPATLDLAQAREYAAILAKSELVPRPLQGKPEAIVLVGLLGQELGVPFVNALSEIFVIENRPSPSAQLRLGLIRRAGHEVMFLESSEERAVIRGRRREHRNDMKAWVTVEWTVEQAQRAGLLDEWAERWQTSSSGKKYLERFVIGRPNIDEPDWVTAERRAGRIKRRENWWKFRPEMLRARAASALSRMHFSDVMLGLGLDPYTAEEHDLDVGHDVDGVYDLEVVEEAELVDELVETSVADREAPEGGPQPAAGERQQVCDGDEGTDDRPAAAPQAATATPSVPSPPFDEPPPWSAQQWRDVIRAAGVTQVQVLTVAREWAAELDVQAPCELGEIDNNTDIAGNVRVWLEEHTARPY
jgi:hypothetical protein